MGIKTWAVRVKDAAVPQVAKWLANRYHLKRLGRITDLKLDSTAQTIFLALALHGEKDLIELTLKYRVLSPEMLEIGGVQASRPWITELINNVIPEDQKRLAVPATVTRILAAA